MEPYGLVLKSATSLQNSDAKRGNEAESEWPS